MCVGVIEERYYGVGVGCNVWVRVKEVVGWVVLR